MAALNNPRWERFAQELARGKGQLEAYQIAGFKPHGANACTLAQDERVSSRVQELVLAQVELDRKAAELAAERLSHSKEDVMRELWDNGEKAKEAGQYGPSNKAFELYGSEIGMFTKKIQLDATFTLAMLVAESYGDGVKVIEGEAVAKENTER